jgi:hypothetical protein
MKATIFFALCLGIAANSAALAEPQNRQTRQTQPARVIQQPATAQQQPAGKEFFRGHNQQPNTFASIPSSTEAFERYVHPGDLGACVGEVANACDANAPANIVAAIEGTVQQPKPLAQIAESSFFDQGLKTKGVANCAHVASRDGATSTEAFVRQTASGTKLIVYKTTRSNKCRASEMTFADGEQIHEFAASKSRVWIVTNSGRVFFMLPSSTVKEFQNLSGQTQLAVSPDGTQIKINSEIINDNGINEDDQRPSLMVREAPVQDPTKAYELLVD